MKLNSKSLVIIPAAALFVESILFIIRPFQIPDTIVSTLYPASRKLATHCLSNPCLYNASEVGSLYTLQLITLITVSTMYYVLGRKNQTRNDQATLAICSLVVLRSIGDYLVGNFSFDRVWALPNTVAKSPLGLFRYAFMFSVASICVGILANTVKQEGGANADR